MRATFSFGGFSLAGLRIVACFLALAPLAGRAQESFWNGTTGFWNTPGYWSPGAPLFSAVVNNGGTPMVGSDQVGGAFTVILGSTGTGNLLVDGGSFLGGFTTLGDQAGSYAAQYSRAEPGGHRQASPTQPSPWEIRARGTCRSTGRTRPS